MHPSEPHPHDVSQILEPALTEIVHSIADRGGQTQAEYEAKAEDTWTLIEAFQPRDAVDLMLTGQLVAMNAVFASATRDVLRGMEDSMKQRTQSGLIAMVRLTQGHVDRLAKRGLQPYRTEIAAVQSAQASGVAAKPPVVEPVAAARPAQTPDVATKSPAVEPKPIAAAQGAQSPAVTAKPAAVEPLAATRPAQNPGVTATPPAVEPLAAARLAQSPVAAAKPPAAEALTAARRAETLGVIARPPAAETLATEPPSIAPPERPRAPTAPRQLADSASAQSAMAPKSTPPDQESSWLDEPYEQWLIETPADLAAKEHAARVAAASDLMKALRWDQATAALRAATHNADNDDPGLTMAAAAD